MKEQMIERLKKERQFEHIWRLAGEIVSAVVEARGEEIVFQKKKKPEVIASLQQIRRMLQESGFSDLPKSDEELYQGIVMPMRE